MSEENVDGRHSSSSSLNSSCHDSEESITIGTMLSREIRENGSLGKRLSHLDSIPVSYLYLISNLTSRQTFILLFSSM